MQVVHEVCCGLDVHKNSVTAWVLSASNRRRQKRVFGTFTQELLALGDWNAKLWSHAWGDRVDQGVLECRRPTGNRNAVADVYLEYRRGGRQQN